jgi:regulation of enolase protein 1 (concanavalin A-like superfamily)
MDFADCHWLNPPGAWRVEDAALHVRTDGGTDFWRETQYGFTRDSGHFLARSVAGDFTAELRVRGRYEQLYDQAGIMVRVDARNWVKAGIERSDGQALLSSVLTCGRSDWATGAYGGDAGDFRIRATVQAGVLRLQVSGDGVRWPLLRLAPFPVADSYLVGPMCCTPERAGLEVVFSDFRTGPALGRELHDLS